MEGSFDEDGRKRVLPDWSNIPNKPLEIIAQKIIALSDYIRFRSVCSIWRSVAIPSIHRRQQPPLLVVEHNPDQDDGASFFSPSTRKLHNPYLPELRNKRILASSYGWLVFLDRHSEALSLLNPVSRYQIVLPSTSEFKGINDNELLNRVPYISCSPSVAGSCVVMVLQCYDEENLAAICRVGETSWTRMDVGLLSIPISIAYHDERLYVLDQLANFTICLADQPEQPVPIRTSLQLIAGDQECACFDLIDGELIFFIYKYNIFANDASMIFLRVCKADPSKPLQLSNVHSFGHKALFFSFNQLFMVNMEGFAGWRENCIYSTYPLEQGSPAEGSISIITFINEISYSILHPEREIYWRWFTPSLN